MLRRQAGRISGFSLPTEFFEKVHRKLQKDHARILGLSTN